MAPSQSPPVHPDNLPASVAPLCSGTVKCLETALLNCTCPQHMQPFESDDLLQHFYVLLIAFKCTATQWPLIYSVMLS